MSGPTREDRLQRYFDGLLEGEERRAFEAEMRADPELAEEVDRSRILDLRLRNRFAPPVGFETRLAGALADAEHEPRRADTRRGWIATGAAAALLLFGLGGTFLWQEWLQTRHGPEGVQVASDDSGVRRLYEGIARELAPPKTAVEVEPGVLVGAAGQCSSPSELSPAFEAAFETKMHIRIVPDRPVFGPEDSAACRAIWPTAITLLGYSGETPVAILADRVESDPGITAPADSSLFAHRREIGGIVLYEIGPFPRPQCLPLFHEP